MNERSCDICKHNNMRDPSSRKCMKCYQKSRFEAVTNADRIRAMRDEELAKSRVIKLEGLAPCALWAAMDDAKQAQYLSKGTAVKVELDWLRQPAEEE